MSPHHIDFTSRRRLLQFLAASPLFARDALAEGLRHADPAELFFERQNGHVTD